MELENWHSIINPDIVDEQITKYVEDNYDDIIALIDKKIDIQVKKAINSELNSPYRGGTQATKAINGKIQNIIQARVDDVQVNEDELVELINKRIRSLIRKATLSIDLPD